VSADAVLRLLQQVATGAMPPEAALRSLAWQPIEEIHAADTAFARLDHHRALRLGFPEVVFCAGKTVEQVVAICRRLAERDGGFLATRADAAVRDALAAEFPAANVSDIGRIVHLAPGSVATAAGPIVATCEAVRPVAGPARVLVVSAGTSDLPVAEEAALTAAAFGNPVDRLYDVGVAGIHRLLGQATTLAESGIVIVVAGMEGALPSVLGGLVRVPVIAVPTSVGYGASFGGLAALLAMLNSCAAGITVVNIDNGFGAACAATRINQLLRQSTETDA